MFATILADRLFLMNGLQKFYTVNKLGLPDQHHQIDGVKIFLAAKTSGQIGFRVDRSIKTVTNRAQKTEAAFCHPARDSHGFLDERPEADLIAQGIKLTAGKRSIRHVKGSSLGLKLTQFFMLITWLFSVNRSISAAVR